MKLFGWELEISRRGWLVLHSCGHETDFDLGPSPTAHGDAPWQGVATQVQYSRHRNDGRPDVGLLIGQGSCCGVNHELNYCRAK
jgi:hypothetical protein